MGGPEWEGKKYENHQGLSAFGMRKASEKGNDIRPDGHHIGCLGCGEMGPHLSHVLHILAFATHRGEELMSLKYKLTMQLDMRPCHVHKLWDFSFSARTEA